MGPSAARPYHSMQATTSELSVLRALTHQTGALADRLRAVALTLDADDAILADLRALGERVGALICAVQHRELARWGSRIDPTRYPPGKRVQVATSLKTPHRVEVNKLPPGAARQ